MQSYKSYLTEFNFLVPGGGPGFKFRPGSVEFKTGWQGLVPALVWLSQQKFFWGIVAILVAAGIAKEVIQSFVRNIDDIIYAIRSAPESRKHQVAADILTDYDIDPDTFITKPSYSDEKEAERIIKEN